MNITDAETRARVSVVWKDGGSDIIGFRSEEAAKVYFNRAKRNAQIAESKLETVNTCKK